MTADQGPQGLKFGRAAADYDRGRPGWPVGPVDAAVTALGLEPGAAVLDVGAGSGRLTEVLAGRFARVIAVEPLASLRELLAAKLPQVDARAGTAERLPVDDHSVAAVFVAEAFHWFDARAALGEAARVLRPSGGIVLLWNIPAEPWQPSVPEARALVREAIARGGEPGGPIQERGAWREAFAGSPFGELHEWRTEHVHETDRHGLVANVMSISSIAGLPDDERAALRGRLLDVVPDVRYRQRLRTDLYWARLQDRQTTWTTSA